MALDNKTGEKPVVKPISKKPTKRAGKKAGKPIAIFFWLAFALIILGLFLFNRETIIKSVRAVQEVAAPDPAPLAPPPPAVTVPPVTVTPAPAPPPAVTVTPAPAPPPAVTVAPAPPAPAPLAPPPPPVTVPSVTVTPAPAPAPAAAAPVPAPQPQPQAVVTRTLYFTQVDRSGVILRVRVSRRIPTGNTPMTDALRALIAGPNADERRQGLISLIPPDTVILSATVRGDTAYISFSEDFRYNAHGTDGYLGQLREVVFTATEFSNVNNVQILIEGQRVNFLGEGIWIGSPISRDML